MTDRGAASGVMVSPFGSRIGSLPGADRADNNMNTMGRDSRIVRMAGHLKPEFFQNY
jgi:hypothetical protein